MTGHIVKYVISISIVFLLASPTMFGQVDSQGNPDPFGTASQPTINITQSQTMGNAIGLETGYSAGYTDNVLALSSPRISDEIHSLLADLTLLHQGSQVSFLVEYIPYYAFYQNTSAYDQFDQVLSGDLKSMITSHVMLRLRDFYSNTTGSNPQAAGTASSSQSGLPTSPNTSVLTQLAAEQQNTVRGDLSWQPNGRSTFTALGSYEQRSFSEQAVQALPLLNLSGVDGGGQYSWRSSERTTLGVLGLFQDIQLSGSIPVASPQNMLSESILPSWSWQATRETTVQAYGGPQFLQFQEVPAVGQNGTPTTSQVTWAAGVSVTKQDDRNVLVLTGQRLASDGGGYLTFVAYSSLSASYHHHVAKGWDVYLTASSGWDSGLGTSNPLGNLTSQQGSFALTHPVVGKLMWNLQYIFSRQTASAAVLEQANFHRSYVTTGLLYQWNRLELRR